ncbi:MAG: hypothetical protein NTX61_06760 [Bacteroidetes bacterium]|nr:hypothetical protein [Bacteroidota bacterium]
MKKKIYSFILAILLVLIGVHQAQAISCVPGAPTTYAPKMYAIAGNDIVVPITFTTFNDINAISLKIDFDGTVMTYISATMGPGFPGAGGNLYTGIDPVTGRLGISYIYIDPVNPGPPPAGITLPDGVLINLTFHYNGGTSPLNFFNSNDGTSLEYQKASVQLPYCDDPQSAYYKNGWVTDLNVAVTPTNPLCYGSSDGTILATPSGGTAPFYYSWSTTPAQTGQTATGLAAGTYTVTVTDFHGATASNSQTLTNPTAVSVTAGSNGPVCNGNSLVLTATASGGTSVYVTYTWNDPLGNPYYGNPLTVSSDYPLHNGLWHVTVTDSHGCNGTGTTTVSINLSYQVSGKLTYYNGAYTAMDNVTITLFDPAMTPVTSATTDISGNYHILNVCNGDYFISVTNNNKAVGGINMTDASDEVNFWAVSPYDIERVQFYAGDVAGSSDFINGTDAKRIQQYFLLNVPFDRPPWVYWRTGSLIHSNFVPPRPLDKDMTLTVAGADVPNINLYSLCAGDFNRSFTPAAGKDANANLQLINGTDIQANPGQEIDVPVSLVNAAKIGAISLILNFPSDLSTIENIYINGSNEQPLWNVSGNELRIGWYSSLPLNIGASGELMVIRLKTSTSFTRNQTIHFNLVSSSLNELADDHNKTISDGMISMNGIIAMPEGITENSLQGLSMTNQPNPFTGSSVINCFLPADGLVTIEIRNLLGVLVKSLVKEHWNQGNHSVRFTPENLATGIYLATLHLKTSKDELTRTIYIVYNR